MEKISKKKVLTALLFFLCLFTMTILLYSIDKPKTAIAGSSLFRGNGTIESPFEISSAEDFVKFHNATTNDHYIGGTNKKYADSHYKLTKDIDLTGKTFNMIKTSFSGSFNGDKKTIKNIKIESSTGSQLALFGTTTSTAVISDIIFENVNVIKTDMFGTTTFLVGVNDGTISGIEVKGNYVVKRFPDIYSGGTFNVSGLVGTNNGTIKDIAISGKGEIYSYAENDSSSKVGGLVITNNGKISDIEADFTNIEMNSYGGSNRVGGLIVENTSSETIKNINIKLGKINCSSGNRVFFGGIVAEGNGNFERVRVNFDNAEGYSILSSEEIIELCFGGIIGRSDNKSNIRDSMVEFKTKVTVGVYSYPYVGGVVGKGEFNLDNSVVRFNESVSISAYGEYRSAYFGGFGVNTLSGLIKNSVVTIDKSINISSGASKPCLRSVATSSGKLTNVYAYNPNSSLQFTDESSKVYYSGTLTDTTANAKIREISGEQSSSDIKAVPIKIGDSLIKLLEQWVKQSGTYENQYARWGIKNELGEFVFPFLTYENPFTQLIDGNKFFDGGSDRNNPMSIMINQNRLYKWTVYDWSTIEIVKNGTKVFDNNYTGEYSFDGDVNVVTVYEIICGTDQNNFVFFKIIIDKEFPEYNQQKLRNNKDFVKTKFYEYEGKYYSNYTEALEKFTEKVIRNSVEEKYLSDVKLFAEKLADGEIVKVGKYYRYKVKNNNLCFFNYDNLLNQIENDFILSINPSYIKTVNQTIYESRLTEGMFDSEIIINGERAYLVKDVIFEQSDSVKIKVTGKENGQTIEVIYGKKITNQIENTNGIYEVNEIDDAGNVSKYNIYFDKDLDNINANIDNKGNLSKNVELIPKEMNGGTFYYNSFEFNNVEDFDRQLIISVKQNGRTDYYNLYEDTLPLLYFSGRYEVTIFDRSKNISEFTIVIESEVPQVKFIKAEKKLKVEISSQNANAFNDLKIHLDNSIQAKDSDGQVVSKDVYNYSFLSDGNYKVVIIDKYFKEHIFEYYFNANELDLPLDYAIFVGNKQVKEVNLTNENVRFEKRKGNASLLVRNENYDKLELNWGDTISHEGKYKVFIMSEKDSELFSFTIDKTAPQGQLQGVLNNGRTNNEVTFTWAEGEAKAVFKNNNKEVRYEANTIISAKGKSEIRLFDKAGNYTIYKFEIDDGVSFELDIENGLITDSKVIFKANEPNLKIEAVKNGNKIEMPKENVFQTSGFYELEITDEFNNKKSFEFTIVSTPINKLKYSLPQGYVWVEAWSDGVQIDVDKQEVELSEDGIYALTYKKEDKSMERKTINITIDTIAPIVKLEGVENGGSTEETVKILCEEKDVNLKVLRNGKEIKYGFGAEISSDGEFEVTVSDIAGNQSTLNFSRRWKMNDAGKVAVGGGGVTIIGAIIELLRRRKFKVK